MAPSNNCPGVSTTPLEPFWGVRRGGGGLEGCEDEGWGGKCGSTGGNTNTHVFCVVSVIIRGMEILVQLLGA